MDESIARLWRWRLARHLRRWGPFWVVGIALAAISEMLWRWETWTVRALLETLAQGGR